MKQTHAVRTKNTLKRGLTMVVLHTGHFGAQKARDAATAPHIPEREKQKLHLLVIKQLLGTR